MSSSSPPSRRRGLTALAAALALLAVTPAGAQAGTPSAAAAASAHRAPAATSATVTLVTGDRVTVTTLADGRSVATVKRPKGLTGGVRTVGVGRSLYVYPDEAEPYLAAGVLDRRLFDVTGLIADGYDDAHAATLPLIVQYGTGTPVAARTAAAADLGGLRTDRPLASIHGAAGGVGRTASTGTWKALTAPALTPTARSRSLTVGLFAGGISHIWLDGKVRATLADSNAQIGAPEVWASGDRGKGVDVAVLDTGIDTAHPDLVGQVAASSVFTPGEDIQDHVGHGTHTASTIAGTGAASGGKEQGVAPAAHLLVGKVLDDTGFGQDSWVLAGMQWAAQTEHAKVISMSLGDPSVVGDGSDPMSQAVDSLSASTGALFVIAAGNSGSAGVSSPGSATSALTVGAVDSGDNLAYFSSTGPRAVDGDPKPEITAPGVDILAARSQYSAEGSGYYTTMSGTSMATPHVAGAAALLASAHLDWTGQQLKDALVSSSALVPGIAVGDGGAGRLDAKAAVLGSTFATATAWSGFYSWPHTADRPATRTITYTNTGGADEQLKLALSATAPAPVFALSAAAVTVPAHGTAQVTVTGDPAAADYGNTDGQVLATDAASGAVVAHTLVGIDKESEKYDLTIRATGRDGKPLGGTVEVYASGADSPYEFQLPDSGVLTARLPKGEYLVQLSADLPGADGPSGLGLAMLSAPQVQLTRSTEVALDARQAHRITAVVPRRTVDSELRMEWSRTMAGIPFNVNYLVPVKYTSLWAQSTAPVTDGSFAFLTRWRKSQPTLVLSGGGQDFADLLPQVGSVTEPPAGSSTLGTVYAGTGSAAAYAGVAAKGKLVVVDHSSAVTESDQAAAAVAAGAAGLLVVNDQQGRLSTWYGSADYSATTPIPVVSLTATEGRALEARIAGGAVRLTLDSTPVTGYAYDLVDRHNGSVPDDLTYRPAVSSLAKVVNRFASAAAQVGDEFRYDMQDMDSYGIGFDQRQQMPSSRTDWVTPGGRGFHWYEEADQGQILQERATITDYRAGANPDMDWFSPVLHPRLNDSTWLPQRYVDFMTINVPGFGDGNAGTAGFDSGSGKLGETLWLYQGSTLITKAAYQAIYTDVPPSAGPLPYRLVAATNQVGAFPYSVGSRTEWTFTSGSTGPDVTDTLPLIQLDYGVATDLGGRASRTATIRLTASQLDGVTRGGRITAGTLAVSYDDGSDWTAVKLSRGADGSWTGTLKAPRSAAFASIRATAKDASGNTVTQTVLEAFGLK